MKFFKCLFVSVFFMLPAISFASDAVVTLKRPGKAERVLKVSNIAFYCGQTKSKSFTVQMDGATTEIPFSAIDFIIYHKEYDHYQVGVKNGTENKSLFGLNPVCKEYKFAGRNVFGGRIVFTPENLLRIDFK